MSTEKNLSNRKQFRSYFFSNLVQLKTTSAYSFRKNVSDFGISIGMKQPTCATEYANALNEALADNKVAKVSRGVYAFIEDGIQLPAHRRLTKANIVQITKEAQHAQQAQQALETQQAGAVSSTNKWELVDTSGTVVERFPSKKAADAKKIEGLVVRKIKTDAVAPATAESA